MTNENIVLFARLKVKKDAVDRAREAALSIVEDSRAENGCINYDFHQAINDATVFLWHETWKNQAAIDAHGESEHFKRFSAEVKDLTDEPLKISLAKMVSEKV